MITISLLFRHKIGNIIAEMGETETYIWEKLLDNLPQKVLPLLVLMANEITSDKIDEQTGFWRYVLTAPNLEDYLKGNLADPDGNTLFHYCASKQSGKDGIKILQLLPQDYFADLHEKINRNQDTILHVAMKNERSDVFDELMNRFNTSRYLTYLYPWLKKIMQVKNTDDNTFISIAIKSKMEDAVIIDMLNKLHGNQIRPLCEESDREENTILHLSAKFARDDLVEYLAVKPVDEMRQNLAGLTALHVAVRQNNVMTVDTFCKAFKNRRIDINQPTSERETVMHIAMKKGSPAMIKLLVGLGGDYAARDEDGNTPLHDLLQLIHLEADDDDEDKTELFYDVWKTMVDNCVVWWCKKLNLPIPDRDSSLYQDLRHDAVYSLRSEISNNEGLSVVEYAATLGMPECVQIMLTHRNVFVFQILAPPVKDDESIQEKPAETKAPKKKKREKPKPKFEIEVSNLMPEYRCKIKVCDGRLLRDILKNKTGDEKTRINIGKRPKNFLETLSKVRPPMKVSDELGTFPMDKLAKHQWYLYQVFIILFLLIHMTVMIWYTLESQTSVKRVNGTVARFSYPNRDSIDAGSSDFIMMIYAASLALMYVASFVITLIRKRLKGYVSTYGKSETFSDYIEAEGAILNSLTHVVAFVAEYLSFILPFVFIVSSILLVFLGRYVDSFTVENYVWMKGLAILTGWLIMLLLGRAYSPIYNFISVLKYIFVKNLVPFLLFYVILSIAFGCAIQLQFQLLRVHTAELEEFGSVAAFNNFFTSVSYVVWELFIMTEGMDTNLRHVQNVGYLFELDKYRSFYIELLIFLYGLISLIVLLNMLIATMNTTYSDVITKQGKGWRQYQVRVSYFSVFFSKSTNKIISRRHHPCTRKRKRRSQMLASRLL